MTFIPSVLSKNDTNNSTILTSTTFVGTSTLTNGYNSIQVTINSNVNSISGGIIIQYSNDNINWTTYYTDTYLSSNIFNKKYNIIDKYYRLSYASISSPTGTITSRLCTTNDDSIVDSINSFDNNIESTIDAFGKLRVTNPQTLLEIKFPTIPGATASFKSNSLQVSSALSGTYSATYINGNCVISGSGTGYFINQSRNFCTYQPGKSLLILASGIIDPGNSSYISRIGYFDNIATSLPNINNGLYFEYISGTIYVSISNNGNTTRIAQTNWNINKMTSAGINNVILDFTKCQLFVIDLEWLGVGRVRFGFYVYGKIVYCHEVTNINILTSPYTSSINLPISYSLIGISGLGSITQICSTVISEGGYNPIGRPFCISNNNGTSLSGETPIILLRGGDVNYYHQNIIPASINILNDSSIAIILFRLRLYRDPTSSSPGTIAWTDVNPNYSVTQYSLACTSFSTANSIIVDEGFFSGKGVSSYDNLSSIFSNQLLQITSNINNVSDILVLTCQTSTASTNAYATIIWNEVY